MDVFGLEKETPETHGECTNATPWGWRQKSNIQHWRCKLNMLTSMPQDERTHTILSQLQANEQKKKEKMLNSNVKFDSTGRYTPSSYSCKAWHVSITLT